MASRGKEVKVGAGGTAVNPKPALLAKAGINRR